MLHICGCPTERLSSWVRSLTNGSSTASSGTNFGSGVVGTSSSSQRVIASRADAGTGTESVAAAIRRESDRAHSVREEQRQGLLVEPQQAPLHDVQSSEIGTTRQIGSEMTV